MEAQMTPIRAFVEKWCKRRKKFPQKQMEQELIELIEHEVNKKIFEIDDEVSCKEWDDDSPRKV